jgi:hypothetical protein
VLPFDLQQHRYRQHQRGKPSLIGFEARTISGINSSRSAVNNSEHRDLRRDLSMTNIWRGLGSPGRSCVSLAN